MKLPLSILTLNKKNITDFAAERNELLKSAKYEWVFFLDSDEKITAKSWLEIKKIIEENKYDLVSVKREDYFHGQKISHGEAGQMRLIRMGKKDKIAWERPVHEKVTESKSLQVLKSQIILQHYAHKNIESFLEKIAKYARLEAEFRYQHKIKFSLFELLFFPVGKFIVNYFWRLGFLDGFRGIIYAGLMSLHSFLVRVYLYELEQKN